MSKYQNGWKVIFEELPILKQVAVDGYYDIDANTMREISDYAPRLLAKMDSKNRRPKVMQEHGLSLLAIENGKYRITKEDPFVVVPDITNKWVFPIKKVRGSVIFDNINEKNCNEHIALHYAYYNNIMDDVFGEKTVPVMGGLRRGSFKFKLGKSKFDIKQVQVDTDGCFESHESIHIVEAKLHTKDTLTLRQLLYPKLLLESMYKTDKKVYVWLMTYDKGIYNFHKFDPSDKNNYCFDVEASKRYMLV